MTYPRITRKKDEAISSKILLLALDIKKQNIVYVRSCEQCERSQKSPVKVLIHFWKKLDENFDRIHIDFADLKLEHQFLVLIDAKSQ